MKNNLLKVGVCVLVMMFFTSPILAVKNVSVGYNSNGIEGMMNMDGEWDKIFADPDGSSYYCYFDAVKQTTDGGYIIVGQKWKDDDSDLVLIKTDGSGNEEWRKIFGDSGSIDGGMSVQQTTDGGYILGGFKNITIAWLVKTDGNGNLLWEKTFGGKYDDTIRCVRETNDESYILAGSTGTYGTGFGNEDYWLIKTDDDGNEMWNKTFGGGDWEYASSVRQTTDGGYIIAGWRESYDGNTDAWLIKTDFEGNVIWEKIFGDNGRDYVRCIEQTIDGGYIAAGIKDRIYDEPESGKGWLIKTDADGNKLWEKVFTKGGNEGFYAVQQTIDEGYVMTGYAASVSGGDTDIWLVKTDDQGDKVWSKTIGEPYPYNDEGRSLQQTSDHGYIILGHNGGWLGLWLIKVNEFPAITSIEDVSGGFGMSVTVKNIGGTDASNIAWSIDVNGTVFVGQHSEGIIPSLPVGEETSLHTMIIGFGPATVKIAVDGTQVSATCFILGFLIMGIT